MREAAYSTTTTTIAVGTRKVVNIDIIELKRVAVTAIKHGSTMYVVYKMYLEKTICKHGLCTNP